MTREEHLKFCRQCKNREFDPKQGIVCGITKRIADFEGTCENFQHDETVREAPATEAADAGPIKKLSGLVSERLREQQDPVYAIVGGLAAATACAVVWALITVSTGYQIGYMAIGVGLLVGYAVRYFGAGIDKYFGVIGGFFALFGCALGNLLSAVVFIADDQSLTYFQALTLLNLDVIREIYIESFSPMDLVFYGIAGYEGYRFAFRSVSEELIKAVSEGQISPLPYAALRLPLVIILFVSLSITGYLVSKGSSGTRTLYHDSGSKSSEGEMVGGKPNGPWEYWWENGNQQFKGNFVDGWQDSTWEYYNEDGVLYKRAAFKKGIQDGLVEEFYANGELSGTGSFVLGRQEGQWSYFYEDGTVSQRSGYALDLPDGPWESFFPDGKPSSKGSHAKGVQVGDWTFWNEDGSKSLEATYEDAGKSKIRQAWNARGVQEIKDGNGTQKILYESGSVAETGRIRDGLRAGQWVSYFEDGAKKEEGTYGPSGYSIVNSWTPEGQPMVFSGEGQFESYYVDGSVMETGMISGGQRTGKWNIFYIGSDSVMQTAHYLKGKMEGPHQSFFEDGTVSIEGRFVADQRHGEWKWYFQGGMVESSINFVDGKKDGLQSFFDEAGTLLRTERYKDGELVERQAATE